MNFINLEASLYLSVSQVWRILKEKFGLLRESRWIILGDKIELIWKKMLDYFVKQVWIILGDRFGLLRNLTSWLGSVQDRANCFTHKKALFIVDQNSVGFIWSPISLDEIDWNFKKTSQNLEKSLGITVASEYFV